MAQSTLRVVEGGGMDKTKALDAALSQIERAFGKGSIMRLGKGGKPIETRSPSIASPKPRSAAASAPSSMPSMRSTRSMPASSASISTTS